MDDDMNQEQTPEFQENAQGGDFDLSQVDAAKGANAGFAVELIHPAKRTPILASDETKAWIKILGRHSDKYRKLRKQIDNRRLQQQGGRGKMKVTADELENESIDTLANLILDWNLPKVDGRILECTYGNAVRLLEDPRFQWIREQLDETLNDDANFMS